MLTNRCLEKPKCIPQCSQPECGYLCRHMIKCTCMDYTHGHLCKHTHKVAGCITYSQCDLIAIKIQSQVNMLNIAKEAENTSIEGEINEGQVDASPPETLSDGSNGDSVCQEENHNVINYSYRGDKQSE